MKSSDQVKAIIECLKDVCSEDGLSQSLYRTTVKEITEEYEEFNSTIPPVKGTENWKKTTVRLLYPHDVKIDGAFRKRAKRHVRSMINFNQRIGSIVERMGQTATI